MDYTSFDEFDKYLSECIVLSTQMHKKMSNNEELKNARCFVRPHKGRFSFFVVIPHNKLGIAGVSCSVPDDVYSLTHEPVYETVLLDVYGRLMSNTLWYNDTCRFETVEQVIAEILKVVKESQKQ